MKLPKKILIASLSIVALFLSWACGVGMAQASAGRNAAQSMTVRCVAILDALEKGKPDAASDWCKTFIVEGDKGRLSDESIPASFLYYWRYHESHKLTTSMSGKIKEVVDSYDHNNTGPIE